MSEYLPSPRISENTSRYNPKIIEKKLIPQTEWAELVRQQQTVAEKMIQQEKDKRSLQKAELNEALSQLVQEKQTNRRTVHAQEKQDDYMYSSTRKQEYDQFLVKLKNDKGENQKLLASEYEKSRWEKDEEMRKKMALEKQAEEKMLSNALDSMQKEKEAKEKRKNDFIRSLDPLLQEKEAQKRQNQEKTQQDKEEQRRLMNENSKRIETQEANYKMYYQKLNEKQNNLQQIYDQRIGQTARSRDHNIQAFIDKGVEEARLKAEEEEIVRQMKKQEQLRGMKDSITSKIQEHQEEQLKQKQSYKDKVEELMKQNQKMQEYNEQSRRLKANEMMDYKDSLQTQMREAEDLRRNGNIKMSEHEKKMHLNQFEGLIPGIRNSKVDALVSPQMRFSRPLNFSIQEPTNSFNEANPFSHGSYTSRGLEKDVISSNLAKSESVKSLYPLGNDKQGQYNPITNPIPNNTQNPYLAREFQRGSYTPKSTLSVVVNKNILGMGS